MRERERGSEGARGRGKAGREGGREEVREENTHDQLNKHKHKHKSENSGGEAGGKVRGEAEPKCLRKHYLLPRSQIPNAAQASVKGRVWGGERERETYSHGVDAGAGPAVSKTYRYVDDADHTEHTQQSHHRLRCVD